MNSDMDNHSEALISQLLAWLQQDSVPTAAAPADGLSADATSADLEMDDLDPLDVEELNVAYDRTDEATPGREPSTDGLPPTQATPSPSSGWLGAGRTGEIPIVQNRFHALLKRRLQLEIERHPPLFPWETSISEYEHEGADAVAATWVPPIHLWMPQIARLNLPVSLPETALAQLLNACTQAMQSSLQPGAKMVRAVGSLFPEQPVASLNDLAGLVLLYPTRSTQAEQLLNTDYEAATDEQKMALSLLAAKEIINELTLGVTPDNPVERQWQTALGQVNIKAEYKVQNTVSVETPSGASLRVQVRLPKGGSATLGTHQASATAQRSYPGHISVELFDLQPNQTYPLEIRFSDLEQEPLVFAIAVRSGNE